MEKLIRFIMDSGKGPTRAWVDLEKYHLKIYFRKTRRVIQGKIIPTFDLASFSVTEEYQGKGYFTKFLNKVEELADECGLIIFVESIINDRLHEFLIKRGYVVANNSDPASLARIKN